MQPHNIDRAADIIIEEFGDRAEQKVIEKVEELMEQNLYQTARNWVKVGYAVREKLKQREEETEPA